MVMTLGAFECGAKEDSASRVNTVHHLINSILFGVYSSFDIAGGCPMETCGYALRVSGVRYHVPSDLLDDKFIETLITIECINYPVSVSPAISKLVGLETIAIGISSEIKPRSRPAFTIAFRF